MTITSAKPWWMSRGVLGGLVAVIAGILGFSIADAAEITKLLTDFASVAGGAMAVYGRIKATRAIAGPLSPGPER